VGNVEKVWKWIKKYWAVLLSLGSAVIGFIIGRRNRGGADSDIVRLRSSLDELRDQLRSARETVEFLERENSELDAETRELGEELREAERAVKLSQQYHADAGDDIERLGQLRDRLAEVLEKYRKKTGQTTDDQ
jgi:uncharacterized coiled-coil DUF342 family protein